MRIALQIFVCMIAFYILWEKPQFLIELGKTNEGILLFIVLLALSVYLSPPTAVLVGTVIIFLVKEGCDCSLNAAKSIQYEISEINVKQDDIKQDDDDENDSNDSNKLPILTASILENHREDVVDFDRSNINKYPKLSCNSCKETDIMIHKEEDLLGKSEVLKPQCCRVYSN
tara:strand:+ start:665 stop:1180 length:516 start_codon:yes stop_codon:yes gene_type:complete